MVDTQTSSLAEQILSTSAPMWKKLRDALKVGTREEAAKLVTRNEQAALIAVSILMPAAEQGSVLTESANRVPASLLTTGEFNTSKTEGKRKKRMMF